MIFVTILIPSSTCEQSHLLRNSIQVLRYQELPVSEQSDDKCVCALHDHELVSFWPLQLPVD